MREFVLRVDENDLKGIVTALSFRPFREVAGIIFKLEQQVKEQVQSLGQSAENQQGSA